MISSHLKGYVAVMNAMCGVHLDCNKGGLTQASEVGWISQGTARPNKR